MYNSLVITGGGGVLKCTRILKRGIIGTCTQPSITSTPAATGRSFGGDFESSFSPSVAAA